MKIGERIRDRRIELGMTQEDLARKLGYKSKTTINKIESGVNDITQPKIEAFARVLSVTPSYLMGWENEDDSYYLDPEVVTLANEMAARPGLKALMDASRKLTTEDLEALAKIVERMNRE